GRAPEPHLHVRRPPQARARHRRPRPPAEKVRPPRRRPRQPARPDEAERPRRQRRSPEEARRRSAPPLIGRTFRIDPRRVDPKRSEPRGRSLPPRPGGALRFFSPSRPLIFFPFSPASVSPF